MDVGLDVGAGLVGVDVIKFVGAFVGGAVGLKVAPGVGFGDGASVGGAVGLKVVGSGVGCDDGAFVGEKVGGEAVNKLFEQVSGISPSVA